MASTTHVAPASSSSSSSSAASSSSRAPSTSTKRISVPEPQLPQLSIEDICAKNLTGSCPRQFQFSPNNKHLVCIGEGKEAKPTLLRVLDGSKLEPLFEPSELTAGEEKLSEAEKLLRETQRISGSGIIAFSWRPDSKAVLFRCGGRVWEYHFTSGLRPVTEPGFKGMEVRYLADSSGFAFVQDGQLYISPFYKEEAWVLGEAGVTYGLADYISAEELDRSEGYWLSPDAEHVAVARVDESPCKKAVIPLSTDGKLSLRERPYCFAGTPNAKVELLIANWKRDYVWKPTLGLEDGGYLARVHWIGEGSRIAVQTINRDQTDLTLKIFDLVTRKQTHEFHQTHPVWVNVHNDLHFLKDGQSFIWKSWEDGNSHLYHYTLDGEQTQLTEGPWEVTRVVGINEMMGTIFFTGFAHGDPTTQQLFSCALGAKSVPARLSHDKAWHSVCMATGGKGYVLHKTSVEEPPSGVLFDRQGKRQGTLYANPLDEKHAYAPYLGKHCETQFGKVTASDGQDLLYSLTVPQGFKRACEASVPLVLMVYGGPGVQRVQNVWSVALEQVLARQGIAVLKVDNRGSTNRGSAFETAIFGHLGKVEVEDQCRVIDVLHRRFPMLDAGHTDVFGWSYGGYMSLLLKAKHPQRFRKTVSVAPVIRWELYDTAYTERYLRTPQGNPDGYRFSSVLPYLKNLKAYLNANGASHSGITLIYGLDDPNVLAQNSLEFAAACQKEGIPIHQQLFPGKMHGIRGVAERTYLFTEALQAFTS